MASIAANSVQFRVNETETARDENAKRALGGAILLTVDKRTFVQRMHEDASFAYKIVRRMARRIRDLEAMLIRLADIRALQKCLEMVGANKSPE